MDLQQLLEKWNIKCDINTVLAMWNESHRSYHNLNHLNDLISQINENKSNFSEKEYEKLMLTAMFHDIVYDPLTGAQGLKRDYVGSMSVHVTNKTSEIFREWSFPSIIPASALKAIELDYTSKELYEVTVTYRSDQWTETRIGEIRV